MSTLLVIAVPLLIGVAFMYVRRPATLEDAAITRYQAWKRGDI